MFGDKPFAGCGKSISFCLEGLVSTCSPSAYIFSEVEHEPEGIFALDKSHSGADDMTLASWTLVARVLK